MVQDTQHFDAIIVGAGAAGLMCAIEAGRRGRRVLVLDHGAKVGEKIRISGGGRCNFTNLHASPKHYLSANPKFCTSALKRFTQHDFIRRVEAHGIAYHEKTLGQLFCDGSAGQIIDMLLSDCKDAGVTIQTDAQVSEVAKADGGFALKTSRGDFACASLVIATGGKSIPKMGATGWGYQIAAQFGLNIIETRAGLAPLTFSDPALDWVKALAGVAVEAQVKLGKVKFREALLFTHRGLSGPAILQISSYWQPGETIQVDLAPDVDVFQRLKDAKRDSPKQEAATVLATLLPKRLAHALAENHRVQGNLADLPDKTLRRLAEAVNAWTVVPSGTEGFRTAEVTVGGVDTAELSSKTFEAKAAPGLYFIGEVVDVTGHLGGFNFQWAWASGFAAGQYA